MLKYGILGLLTYGVSTGYEINELFQSSLNFFWNAQKSQIYREIQNLEKEKWITISRVQQPNRPDKQVCTITPAGRKEFLRWLADPDQTMRIRSSLLMKVFFFGERTREENIRFFRQFIRDCQDYAASIQPAEEQIRSYASDEKTAEKALYWEMTVSYGQAVMHMNIAWAEECIRKLEAEK